MTIEIAWDRIDEPGPLTPVLTRRPLRPGVSPDQLSRFGDNWWNLRHAVFESHADSYSVNFDLCPSLFCDTAKRFIWLLLNGKTPTAVFRGNVDTLSIPTVCSVARYLFRFLAFLEEQGIVRLSDVSAEVYEEWARLVKESHRGLAAKEDLITEVRRLWTHRELMRPGDALPDAPPWAGELTRHLVGTRKPDSENATPRLSEGTTQALLMWAIRYVDDLSGDILPALEKHKEFWGRDLRVAGPDGSKLTRAQTRERLQSYLEGLAARNEALPATRSRDGHLAPRWAFLARVAGVPAGTFWPDGPGRAVVEASSLPLAEDVVFQTPLSAHIGDQRWLEVMNDGEVLKHVRDLTTACFVVTAYLSGMRPGEALGLVRGCVEHDAATELWLVYGTVWKGVRDQDGRKAPEGQTRQDPWVVAPVVARAIAILERLSEHEQILFTAELPGAQGGGSTRDRLGHARTRQSTANDLRTFIGNVNSYCAEHGRSDAIPPSSDGRPIMPSQLRRTLAWHIYRRPRGIVAGAIQYGHLRAQMFLGYAGNYTSGFADLAAMEDLLTRLDGTAENVDLLAAGEHVSGPAASGYRKRVHEGAERFQGITIRTNQQARSLLTNPNLQVFVGTGMTCVFDVRTAKCHAAPPDHGDELLPTLDACQPNCQNIARTDRDIAAVDAEIRSLERIVNDPLSPSMRVRRDRQRLEHLRAIATEHQASFRVTTNDPPLEGNA